MDIVDLPRDLFLLIVAHLSARTAVSCRRVSRRWNGAFADDDLSLRLLKWHFPRCREVRLAFSADPAASAAVGGCAAAVGAGHGEESHDERGREAQRRAVPIGSDGGRGRAGWAAAFAAVARRYHHLRTAAPRCVEKIRHGAGAGAGAGAGGFLPVATWDRYLRLHDKTAPFHYPDLGWCYGQEDGLLVYRVCEEVTAGAGEWSACPWRLLDLEARLEVTVPFAQGGERAVRRVRLSDGVLIFEWCEREAEHQPFGRGGCPRHFVTVYDVVRTTTRATPDDDNDDNGDDDDDDDDDDDGENKPEKSSSGTNWTITQRAEFRMLLGTPVSIHSRFLSTHTNTHYAVYVWQPDRTSREDDDPVDVVIVWDISTPGQPRVLRRMPWSTLDFYGVRQRSTPRLRCLGMDDRNLYFAEEEHRWEQGGHGSLSPPRVHLVRSTGVPVIPTPSSVDGRGGGQAPEKSQQVDIDINDVVVQGPRWVDECGANGDVNMSFCSRARTCPHHHHHHHDSASTPLNHMLVTGSPTAPGIWHGEFAPGVAGTSLAREIEASIRAPVGRWPGWAPCWRHEEFPYLTVSEVVDFRAGVRVTARQCFMLETLSVHVRPLLSVGSLDGRNTCGGGDAEDSSSSSSSSSSSRKMLRRGGSAKTNDTGSNEEVRSRKGRGHDSGERTSEDEDGGGNGEVQFADEMWDALLGKGFIFGDERWLIGEDKGGTITILRF
ncbi:hypothetical protein VM1G_02650 [Cytospora mali]|uniref:F-box domain-containing protein n=1 Tax=Cytospora mali TaxID=578113 RepID=A0A194VU72_CYTMA|nr:hypothetical protein VM1G_02650 [Valsa mali]